MSSTVARKTGSATLVIEQFSEQTSHKDVGFEIKDYCYYISFGIQPYTVVYNDDYVSIYLFNSKETFKFKVFVFILDSEGNKLFIKESCGTFGDGITENFFSLMPRSKLFSTKNSYLFRDKLTLLCELEVIEDEEENKKTAKSIRDAFINLSENFQSLLSDGKFTDFTLVVEKNRKEFLVHKAILAARSSVFAAMFEHDCEEKRQNQVNITDMDEEVCAEMLSYIYTGKVKGLDRYTMELLVAADKYQLESLKTLCEQYLASNLAIESAVNVLIMADLYRASDLKVNCFDYIWHNATSVKATDGWKMLTSAKRQLFEELFDHLAKKYHK